MDSFQKSLLFALWQGLSSDEQERLGLMVVSPFHNQHEGVTRLYQYLFDCTQSKKEPLPKEAHQAIFGKKPFEAAKLRHVMSYLTRLIEDFLLWQASKESRQRPTELLRVFQTRKMQKPFEHLWNEFQRESEVNPLRDGEYHRLKWQAYGSLLDMEDARSPKAHHNIQKNIEELDLFFLVEKLKSACAALSHQRLYKMEYELGLLEAAVEKAKQLDYLGRPEIGVYYQAYLTLTDQEESRHFNTLTKELSRIEDVLPKEQQKSLLLLAINYCIGRMNKGQQVFRQHALDLYRKGLESDLLLEDGQLSPYTYKNICSAALLLQEFDWAQSFLHQYQSYLPENLRESYFTYNLARLHLKQKKFTDVISLLNRVYVKDIFTQLATRVIHIQAGYEQGDLEFVEYQLDNLRQTLHRKELLASHKKNYGNFVKLARRVVRLPEGPSKERERLGEEILSTKELVEREWLLEKTQHLTSTK
jgi:hypothetical protein